MRDTSSWDWLPPTPKQVLAIVRLSRAAGIRGAPENLITTRAAANAEIYALKAKIRAKRKVTVRPEIGFGWFIIDRKSSESLISRPEFRSSGEALSKVRSVVEDKYKVFYWDQPGWVSSGTYWAPLGSNPQSLEEIQSNVVDFVIR